MKKRLDPYRSECSREEFVHPEPFGGKDHKRGKRLDYLLGALDHGLHRCQQCS